MLDTLRMIMRSIFDSAIDNDLCYKNPAKNAKMKSNYEPAGRKVYTKAQSAKLYAYAIETGQLDFMLLLKTGMRRSELLALKWSDVDPVNRCVWVRAAVTPSPYGTVEGKTKSAVGTRAIPVDDDRFGYLQSLSGDGYIIAGSTPNTFLSPTTYAKNFRLQMEQASYDLSIPALTPHEL